MKSLMMTLLLVVFSIGASAQTVKEDVYDVVVDVFHVELSDVSNETEFGFDLGAGYSDMQAVYAKVREKLSVEITPDEAEQVETVEDLILMIEAKQ